MMHRVRAFALGCAFVLTCAAARSVPAAPPHGPAVEVALAYARAVGRGDYASAYRMLARGMHRYFGSVGNYASVFEAERFRASDQKAVRLVQTKTGQVVTIRENISYLNHGTQGEGHGRLVTGYVVVREAGAWRVDDAGHPYRSFVPDPSSRIERDGVRLVVRELAFYPRRIELTLSFENLSSAFVTFLPYGRTLLRDQYGAYHPLVTKNWLLTDRQLFLGLRLAPNARYTGQIDFLVDGRLDDRARSFSLNVAPALREGADQPEAFALPQITVPAS
jgi:hypothetical protein